MNYATMAYGYYTGKVSEMKANGKTNNEIASYLSQDVWASKVLQEFIGNNTFESVPPKDVMSCYNGGECPTNNSFWFRKGV